MNYESQGPLAFLTMAAPSPFSLLQAIRFGGFFPWEPIRTLLSVPDMPILLVISSSILSPILLDWVRISLSLSVFFLPSFSCFSPLSHPSSPFFSFIFARTRRWRFADGF